MDKKSDRIEYFDTAKALLILLVILGHVVDFRNADYKYQIAFKLIYSFHVPAFFMVNGMLMSRNKKGRMTFYQFLKIQIRKLIIPYCVFETIASIFIMLFKLDNDNWIQHMIRSIKISNCNAGANWFLIALLLVNLVLFFYDEIYSEKNDWILIVALLILYYILRNFPMVNVITRGIIGLLFVLLGYKLKPIFMAKKDSLLIFIGMIFLWAFSVVLNGAVYVYYCSLSNVILTIISCVAGTWITLRIAKIIDIALFKYIGKNTIIVVGTHQPLLMFLREYFGEKGHQLAYNILIFLCIVCVEIIVIYIINYFKKIIPFL